MDSIMDDSAYILGYLYGIDPRSRGVDNYIYSYINGMSNLRDCGMICTEQWVQIPIWQSHHFLTISQIDDISTIVYQYSLL